MRTMRFITMTMLTATVAVVLLATGCASTGTDYTAAPNDARYDFVNSIGIRMVYISPGEYEMGSPHLEWGRRENEELHTVRLTNGYYMGIFEITQDQWNEYLGALGQHKPLRGSSTLAGGDPGFWQTGKAHPVTNVSWYDVMGFCQWLSQREGRNYRLPTEAEWEYAARAGSRDGFPNGTSWNSKLDANIDGVTWRRIYGDVTFNVGRFTPNPWGLYDMSGNVMEWIGDYYCRYDEGGFVVNPAGPDYGCDRVVRGGHFNAITSQTRTAYRQGKPPTVRSNAIGFRVVMDPEGCEIQAPQGACNNCLTIHAVNRPRCIDYAPRPYRQYTGR